MLCTVRAPAHAAPPRQLLTLLVVTGFLVVFLQSLSVAAADPQDPAAKVAAATQPSTDEEVQPWLEPIPVAADPELEEQIQEVQNALTKLHQQTVRRKEALRGTTDATQKTKLYEELEVLRKERSELEALLHDLIEEAKISEQTAIDEALARARWLERQQERQAQREELIRDRQE